MVLGVAGKFKPEAKETLDTPINVIHEFVTVSNLTLILLSHDNTQNCKRNLTASIKGSINRMLLEFFYKALHYHVFFFLYFFFCRFFIIRLSLAGKRILSGYMDT